MKFYLKRKASNIDAVADYSFETKKITVLKGSKLSDIISHSARFRGANTIEKVRVGNINADNILINDVVFNSPSTAANFVTGTSTNGCIAWKNENGLSFREVVGKE